MLKHYVLLICGLLICSSLGADILCHLKKSQRPSVNFLISPR